jgi:tRNA (guanine-N1)-methyltransferase
MDDAASRFRVVEVSLGDYVLAGGEVAVLVVVEAVARLLPGVLGNAESHRDDSFATGSMASLLEGPVYTRPPVWRDLEVPRRPAVRGPRAHRPLAARRGAAPHGDATAGAARSRRRPRPARP